MPAARVMVVDDDEDIRSLLCTALSLEGVTVVAEAANEDEAVPEAARSNPDVVIVDGRLSGDESGSLLRRLKLLTPRARLIAYSGVAAAIGAPPALEAGAHVYVEKRDLPSLLEVIRDQVARSTAVHDGNDRGDRSA
jgi:DNA-binding NarL/FixJ family response regulator